jgi:hypothetical protein
LENPKTQSHAKCYIDKSITRRRDHGILSREKIMEIEEEEPRTLSGLGPYKKGNKRSYRNGGRSGRFMTSAVIERACGEFKRLPLTGKNP